MEPLFLNFLRDTLGIKGIKRVSMHEPLTNIRKVIALICERDMPTTEIWRALYGAAVLHRAAGKYVIALNDDIDPENADAILWAMSYRANADLDMHILPHRDQGHGPRSKRNGGEDASVLIDATLKENFPPISLPKREYMENATQDLGGARPAQAQAGGAVVRLFARRMVGGLRRSRRARHARRLFRHRQETGEAPAQGRAHEHRGAQREGVTGPAPSPACGGGLGRGSVDVPTAAAIACADRFCARGKRPLPDPPPQAGEGEECPTARPSPRACRAGA